MFTKSSLQHISPPMTHHTYIYTYIHYAYYRSRTRECFYCGDKQWSSCTVFGNANSTVFNTWPSVLQKAEVSHLYDVYNLMNFLHPA